MNKQELENRIKDLENEIKSLKNAVVSVDEKAWKPEGEEIYYGVEGLRVVSYHNNDQFDKDMISIGNYFKTEEQAERALFEQTLRLKLRKFAEDNDDAIDWKVREEKFYLMYDYEEKKIEYDYVYTVRDFSQIYFSSEEIAKSAIEQFKDELIKYFTEQ